MADDKAPKFSIKDLDLTKLGEFPTSPTDEYLYMESPKGRGEGIIPASLNLPPAPPIDIQMGDSMVAQAKQRIESPTQKIEKPQLKDIYQMTAFDQKSGIAMFGLKDLKDLLRPGSFNMYMKAPENMKSQGEVQGWLDQAGEDSGWVDVDIKYKLLQKAREWKVSQDGYEPGHPKVSLEMANAQETYNLTVLAEQTRLLSEFRLPDSDMNMNHA